MKARNFQIDCSAGKVMMQLPGGGQIDIRGTNQCFMTILRGLLCSLIFSSPYLSAPKMNSLEEINIKQKSPLSTTISSYCCALQLKCFELVRLKKFFLKTLASFQKNNARKYAYILCCFISLL